MTLLHALVLGLVEGLTEFLPVSSTAHLILTSKFLALENTEFLKFFEVFIQSGAILAVLVLYAKFLLKHKEYLKNIFFSFIPTAIVGFALHKIIKTIFFDSMPLIIFALFSVGVIFIITEYFVKKGSITLTKSTGKLTIPQALFIGLIQSLAVIPGVSRAGAVILAMMFLGYKREDAAIYSFILAVPTILAASIFDLSKTNTGLLLNSYPPSLSGFGGASNLQLITIGFVTSFITALLVIKWFIKFIQQKDLTLFGVYRIILAIALLILVFSPLKKVLYF